MVTVSADTQERNWGAEAWRAPHLAEGDECLYSECGRIVMANTYGHGNNGIDYRSHYFRIVSGSRWLNGCYLLVKHGAGQERIKLDYSVHRARQFFEPLDSTQRYLLMHMLYSVHSDARRNATTDTARTYRQAFVDGRLKKRKERGSNNVKVWIE